MGSYSATLLARRGHCVVVLERKSSPREAVCCTGIVSEECLAEFNIDPSLAYRHPGEATVYSPNGRALDIHRSTPQAAVLDRPAFNSFMAERSMKAGAEYWLNAKATDLRVSPEGVAVTVERGSHPETVLSKTMILSTGSDQTMVRNLNMRSSSRVVAGVQAEVETDSERVEIFTGRHVAPGYFAWLVPTSPHRGLAGLLVAREPKKRLEEFLEFLLRQGKIGAIIAASSSAPLPLSHLRCTYGDRFLVTGTAAGLVKPTTGGGIYFGMISAEIAAEVLGDALARGDFSASSLSRYETLWKQKLGRELKMGAFARRVFGTLSDSSLDALFVRAKASGVIDALLSSPDLTFDWHGKVVDNLLRTGSLTKLIKGVVLPLGRRSQKDRVDKRRF